MTTNSSIFRRRQIRSTGFETLESRLVFSVDSLAGILDAEPSPKADLKPAASSIIAAHLATGAKYVLNEYEFDGTGQTVVVIDSGIAWDHYALGGGYGANARVVGGWDFAEGDANPYDDGPAGFHGTHVAGIIGSDDINNRGVASGVDLVALRVFSDNGGGNLQWVEQALRWVHQHKSDFEHPITTVNLSLGVDWNGGAIPGWAVLEDEFAQLERDGLFISVAAGNSFNNYRAVGLAYPAASEFVVPVASHGTNGLLSDFSQRNERVIVAPGESIRSTVPDHFLGNSQTGAFLGASGTSMASPYVAGASAVVRQAMDFMGMKHISQDMIYDHFRQTADQIYDAVTGGTYSRLNLGRAVDAIVNDSHADVGTGTSLGALNGPTSFAGTIGKKSDVDTFSFTAGTNGRVSLSISQSHQLSSIIHVNGTPINITGNQAGFNVVAGQNYTLSLSTADGIGHYQVGVDLKIDKSVSLINGALYISGTSTNDQIGVVESNDGTHISVSVGSTRYRFASAQVRTINVEGYSGYDQLYFKSGASVHNVTLGPGLSTATSNGITLTARGFESLMAVGSSDDVVTLLDTAGNDHFRYTEDAARMDGTGLANIARGFGTVIARSTNGIDQATVIGSGGVDQVTSTGESTTMKNEAVSMSTTGFARTRLIGNGSADKLWLYAGNSGDFIELSGQSGKAWIGGTFVTAAGFSETMAFASGSGVSSKIVGTAQSEYVWSSPAITQITGTNYQGSLIGFTNITVDGSLDGGIDTAQIADSDGNDQVVADHLETRITSENLRRQIFGFDSVTLVGKGRGVDTLSFTGTGGRDLFFCSGNSVNVYGTRYQFHANGFNKITVSGGGGLDEASLKGTTGNNLMGYVAGEASMSGEGFGVTVRDFENVRFDGNGGQNVMTISGFGDGDLLTANDRGLVAWLANQRIEATNLIWLEASTRENQTASQEIGAVDFWYALHGDWVQGV